MPRRHGLCFALALLLVAGGSLADPPLTQSQFATATKHFDEHDYATALTEFEALVRATGSPNARFYVARCHLLLGHLARAYDEMGATVRDAAARASAEPKYEGTRDAAAAELSVLERRVGRLLVTLAAPPAGAQVSINGVAVAAARLGSAVSVDPGTATVEVTAPARAPARQDVTVAPGELKNVFFAFDASPPPSASSVVLLPPSAPPPPARHPLRTAALVSGGAAVTGLGVFTVFALVARSKYNGLVASCGQDRCRDAGAASDVDAGKRAQAVANIGLAVAVVGTVTGVTLWLVDGATAPDVALTPGGAVASVQGRF